MGYVVQVRTGAELKLAERFRHEIKTEGEDIFVPMYERRKSIRGEWTRVKRPLFPGYIFFETEDAESLYFRLKKIDAFNKILSTGHGEYTPIQTDEEMFLRALIGEDYVAQESVGVIEGDQIIVMHGPLKGLEGSIVKINRHKRIAIIRAEFMGGAREVKVGLEIIDKRPAKT